MNSKLAVIFGPAFGRYTESVARGLVQNGWSAASFHYPSPPATLIETLSWSVLPRHGLTSVRKMWLDSMVKQVTEACQTASLLILVKADELTLSQYEELLDDVRCPKVLWLMDSVQRVEEGLQRANMADALLYFEGTDRPSLARLSVPYHHVAVAADPHWYYPIAGQARTWDISFVGAPYANRLSMFESILSTLPRDMGIRARFVGPYISHLHPVNVVKLRRKYPLTAAHLKHGENLPHESINMIYNRSRICLNMFHEQSLDSLNPRAFETCCSGSFLLSEFNRAISRSFSVGDEMETFHDAKEAADKIVYYLQHETLSNRIAAAGRSRVMREHTIKVRMREILATLAADGLL